MKIFHRIRKKLLVQGRIARYFTYAVGEIVLVVIGILIALQINSWNENRINKDKEKLIILDLRKEFEKNKVKLDSTINYHRALFKATQEVMNLIGETQELILQHNTDSLLYLALDYSDFSPSESVISELISSGKLNLISSESLRMLIFDWGSAIDEKEEGYDTMDEMSSTQTLPYLTRNGSLKDIDQYGLLKMNGPSKFPPQNHLLFQELEFENHMDNQAWGITNYLTKLERLENIIDEILRETSLIAQV
ncbi:DUF6090 family protein [Halocola ammonii]